jgi:hypothetical protein
MVAALALLLTASARGRPLSTSPAYRGGAAELDPTFYVSFSFGGCPGWCLVKDTPVFTLHRGGFAGPRVALGTYLYHYSFSDMPDDPSACSEFVPLRRVRLHPAEAELCPVPFSKAQGGPSVHGRYDRDRVEPQRRDFGLDLQVNPGGLQKAQVSARAR